MKRVIIVAAALFVGFALGWAVAPHEEESSSKQPSSVW
jgi:hypothetical protein